MFQLKDKKLSRLRETRDHLMWVLLQFISGSIQKNPVCKQPDHLILVYQLLNFYKVCAIWLAIVLLMEAHNKLLLTL